MFDWLKGWKTMLFSAIVVLVGIADLLQVIDLHALLGVFLPAERVGAVAAFLGLIFGILRLVTNSGVFKAPEEAPASEEPA